MDGVIFIKIIAQRKPYLSAQTARTCNDIRKSNRSGLLIYETGGYKPAKYRQFTAIIYFFQKGNVARNIGGNYRLGPNSPKETGMFLSSKNFFHISKNVWQIHKLYSI